MNLAGTVVIALMFIASGSAWADHRSHIYFGLSFGPYWLGPSPWYYPAPAYYPPVVIERERAPIIIQQPTPTAPPAAFWYYCRSANAYYPYVRSCPSGWEAVPAQPPAGP